MHRPPPTNNQPPPMPIDRRDFVGRVATGALFAGLPLPVDASIRVLDRSRAPAAEDWDLTWVDRLTGKYRAIFDVPEIDSGYGVWRASIWGKQYQEVLGAKPNELSTVLVLRDIGIQLAMQQAFLEPFRIGEEEKGRHPVTPPGTDPKPA